MNVNLTTCISYGVNWTSIAKLVTLISSKMDSSQERWVNSKFSHKLHKTFRETFLMLKTKYDDDYLNQLSYLNVSKDSHLGEGRLRRSHLRVLSHNVLTRPKRSHYWQKSFTLWIFDRCETFSDVTHMRPTNQVLTRMMMNHSFFSPKFESSEAIKSLC